MAKLSDWQRLKQAATYHGIAALGLILLWAAADTWYVVTELFIAHALSVVAALVAGAWLSSLVHEWGHFAGARLAKSYSPIVPEVRGIFMFGFKQEKNTRNQFLAMSLGGPIANWLLVLAILVFIPMDNAGRAALLAITFAKAVSVCIFEGPIISRVMSGGEPDAEIEYGLNNGSQDRGIVLGYLSGALVWLLAS
ncbi:MAG: hypothetical protein ACE37D_07495 [Pseudomonadales bacterium]